MYMYNAQNNKKKKSGYSHLKKKEITCHIILLYYCIYVLYIIILLYYCIYLSKCLLIEKDWIDKIVANIIRKD